MQKFTNVPERTKHSAIIHKDLESYICFKYLYLLHKYVFIIIKLLLIERFIESHNCLVEVNVFTRIWSR